MTLLQKLCSKSLYSDTISIFLASLPRAIGMAIMTVLDARSGSKPDLEHAFQRTVNSCKYKLYLHKLLYRMVFGKFSSYFM